MENLQKEIQTMFSDSFQFVYPGKHLSKALPGIFFTFFIKNIDPSKSFFNLILRKMPTFSRLKLIEKLMVEATYKT